MITKALIEIPPKWAGHKPVFPGAAAEKVFWPGATGLAEDVRRYGKWMRDEAQKRIGNLYPKVNVGGVKCTVIAWLWARTVTCPNPACASTMPLVRSFWLGRRKGKERYVIPIPDGKRVRFEIGGPDGVPRDGTITGRTGAVCLICGTPASMPYIRAEGKAGRMGQQLMAVVAEGRRQRFYAAPDGKQETAADVPRPEGGPEAALPDNARWFSPPFYGMTRHGDIFTNRQLNGMLTFTHLVGEAHERIIADGGTVDYADAVSIYLGLATTRIADLNNSIVTWSNSRDQARNMYARQAMAMSWDFAEVNPFAMAAGDLGISVETAYDVIRALPATPQGVVEQRDARQVDLQSAVVATDPPYYDNVGYADLSDFFYVWLRQALGQVFPDILGTMLTPKATELVADPFRRGSKDAAEQYFEDGFTSVFKRVRTSTPADFPILVFYAFKQSESDSEGNQVSTGWDTMLEGMVQAGWMVTATWPIRTERAVRTIGIGTNALASSIVLACRPRPTDAGFTDRRGLIQKLREEFPEALRKLEQGKVAPVDLRQAAIGPGMAVFSRYARVNEPDGSPMRVRAALTLINQVLDERLAQLEGSVSADTRFCVEWFKQNGFDEGLFGTAETLSKGIDTSITGLERAGVLRSRAGKVKLLSVQELPENYDPTTDDRTSEWEICLHLAKRLQDQGTNSAAALMAASRGVSGIDLDDVQELSYLLYSIAEKKNWTETALLFNNLGTSWTDIEDESRKAPAGTAGGQGEFTLDFGGDDDGDE